MRLGTWLYTMEYCFGKLNTIVLANSFKAEQNNWICRTLQSNIAIFSTKYTYCYFLKKMYKTDKHT
jgi:hypothetical protein